MFGRTARRRNRPRKGSRLRPISSTALILVLVNECAACLREHVVDDPDLIDGAVIFGTGFAPFRGGPLNYARSRGVASVVARLEELSVRCGPRFSAGLRLAPHNKPREKAERNVNGISVRPKPCATMKCKPLRTTLSPIASGPPQMVVEEREASVQLLKTLAPLDGLKRDNIAALAKKVTIRKMSSGRNLFKEGDTDRRTMWLISGMLEISEAGRTVAMIRGGTRESPHAVISADSTTRDRAGPRKKSAISRSTANCWTS